MTECFAFVYFCTIFLHAEVFPFPEWMTEVFQDHVWHKRNSFFKL